MRKVFIRRFIILIVALVARTVGVSSLAAATISPTASSASDSNASPTTKLNDCAQAITEQPDGSIIIGGAFTQADDTVSNRLVRINANGALDTTFTVNLGVGFNDSVTSAALQTDGKIIVGGRLTTSDGVTSNRLVWLNVDGTRDTDFSRTLGSGFDNPVFAVLVQSDNKIVVGGDFRTVDGAASNSLARLNSDSAPDRAFTRKLQAGFNGAVFSVNRLSNGTFLIGGLFTKTDRNTTYGYLARLRGNGALDRSFIPPTLNDDVLAVGPSGDGLLAGGLFTS